MNAHLALERLFSGPVVERFGWTLVHSLWQFALVALVAGAIVRTMPRQSSAARYVVLVVAMSLSVTAPAALAARGGIAGVRRGAVGDASRFEAAGFTSRGARRAIDADSGAPRGRLPAAGRSTARQPGDEHAHRPVGSDSGT